MSISPPSAVPGTASVTGSISRPTPSTVAPITEIDSLFTPLTRTPTREASPLDEVVTISFPALSNFDEHFLCQGNPIFGPLPLDGVERVGSNAGSLAMPPALISKLTDNADNNNEQCFAWNDYSDYYSFQSEELPEAIAGATVWYSFEGTGEEVGISFCSLLTEMEVQPVLFVNDGTFCNDNSGAFFLEDPDPDYFWWKCGSWLTPAGRHNSDCCSMLLADTVEYHMYFLGVQGKNSDEGTFGLALYSHFNGCEESIELPVDGTATVLTDSASASNPLRQTMSSQGRVVWLTFTGTGSSITVGVKGGSEDSGRVRLRTYRLKL